MPNTSTKKEMRQYIRELKKKQLPDVLLQQSEAIWSKVENHPLFINSQTILLYYSLPDEVYTHDFIRKWHGKKNILLPVVQNDILVLKTYQGDEELKKGSFSIYEPMGEDYTLFDKIDLVFVPGMAFDKSGNRLGRGKGYYDKLLPHIKAPKIGICYSWQIVFEVPVEDFDIKMSEVILADQR